MLGVSNPKILMKFKFLIFTLSIFMIGFIVIDNVQSQDVGPGPVISDSTDVTPGYYYTFGTRDEGSNYSTVGTVHRWHNIGYQYLKNIDTGQYESFDEPKDFLPDKDKEFFKKKVKVDFYATGRLDATRADSFKGHVACMGKVESTAGWTHHLGDVNDKTIYQKNGGDATGSVSCSASSYYIVDEPQTITYSVTAYGAAVSEHGGGAGGGAGGAGFSFSLNYAAGSVTAPQGFPGVVQEPTESFTIEIRSEDEFPTGTKCAVPNIGLYGTSRVPLCPADADAGHGYEVPGTHYHSYVCYGNGCIASGFSWICYNSPCGHPEWWYFNF